MTAAMLLAVRGDQAEHPLCEINSSIKQTANYGTDETVLSSSNLATLSRICFTLGLIPTVT